MPDTAPQVDLDDEGKRLQQELAKAEFRQKTAEANAARMKAIVPSGSTAPAAGDITIGTGAGTSLASVVAAGKLHDAAKAIAKALETPSKGKPILIVEDRAVAVSDAVLTDVQSSIDALGALLDDIERSLPPIGAGDTPYESLEPGADEGGEAADGGEGAAAEDGAAAGGGGGATPASGGPLGLVGDVIGMLRSDYDVQNVAVRLDRMVLFAEIARCLGSDAKVILPSIALVAQAPILTEARALVVRRFALSRRIDRFENQKVDPMAARIAAAQAHLTGLQTAHDKLVADADKKAANLAPEIEREKAAIATALSGAEYQTARAVVDSAKTSFAAFDTAYAAFSGAPASGNPPLVQAAIRQQIRVLTPPDDPCLLWVDITASGGDVVKKKSPLGWNSEVSFLGAVQTVFLLASSTGALLASGAETKFGFRTWDFDDFFGDSRRGAIRQIGDWVSALVEPLVVILVLVVVLVVIAKVIN